MARLLWQQRQDIGPGARFGSAVANIQPSGRTLLWGGVEGDPGGGFQYLGDTWEWDGDGWVQVADIGPAPFVYAAMAFDSKRNVAVFYTSDLNGTAWATWEWDGESWTQVEDTGPQAAQAVFQLVYDAAREVTILEGGSVAGATSFYTPVGTWQWDGISWTQVSDVGPPARALTGLAYDASRERVVLFGGANLDPGSTLEPDTWEWNGNVWEQITNIGPAPRFGHAMTGTSAATLLFGGLKANAFTSTNLLRDTWTWDGKHWHQRQDMGPSPRFTPAMSWDNDRQRAVLFGGAGMLPNATTLTYFGDTWESLEWA
jgi:hypothetical protein